MSHQMVQNQDFEIQNTFKPTLFITTTGISETEKSILKEILPKHIVLEDCLNTSTNYLICYKAQMSDKYIQALKWGIKILNIKWLYNIESNTKKYEMLPYEECKFTVSEISNDTYINYYILMGASFEENLSLATDFMISKTTSGEKIDYCKKYQIPVILPEEVFTNDFQIYKKEQRYDAVEIGKEKLFDGKTFYLDPELPKPLFNKLRRSIIENSGTRVSSIDKEVEYIFTFNPENYENYADKLFYYQYIFDCIDSNAILYEKPYKALIKKKITVLNNVCCNIDSSLKENRIQVSNKLKALGAVVKLELDINCTHLIIKDKREYTKNRKTPYKIVASEWIDQCLYTLKYIKEDKYIVKPTIINIFSKNTNGKPLKKIKYVEQRKTLFQFTGLPSFLRNNAIKKLDELQVKYSNTEKYENCTHLIMGTVNTSEKFLSTLCNGGWILRPDFIDAFDNSPNFDYSKYEWRVDENTIEKDIKIIESIKKWRQKIEISGRPAFHKWIVKLYCNEPKRNNYVRVIENGGGKITEENNHTHCFVARNYKDTIPEKKYYSTDYIFSHLFN